MTRRPLPFFLAAALAAFAAAALAPGAARAQDDDVVLPPIETGEELERAAPADGGVDESGRVDLNRATLARIEELPIPAQVARALWERREYVDDFRDLSDLLEAEGMTPELLAAIRPLIRIEPIPATFEHRRKDDLFYRFEFWEGAEGTDESLVELYKDLALDPIDVNSASLLDLQNLQGVSPVDAVAIWNHRKIAGKIANQSALRRVNGLSGFGYSNARDFLTYQESAADDAIHGNYALRVETTTYFDETEDLLRDDRDPGVGTNDNWWDRLELDDPSPAVYQKLRARHGRHVDFGGVTNRVLGDEKLFDTVKGYVGVEGLQFGPASIDRIIVGNYQVSWGQGVAMENTDFRSARKSGYGFQKRYDGILGDLSRTQQFTLRGVAAEGSAGPVRAIAFFSDDDRDAILNEDGSVNQLLRLTPRISNEALREAGLGPIRDQLNEETYGGNLRYSFAPGTWLGVGGYESRYDRFFDPKWDPLAPVDKHPLVADADEDNFAAQDSEFFSAYRSNGKYRRVVGADFQTVVKNLSVQGEYAELDTGGEILKVGDDPKALVLSSFLQYENLNLLTIWRDYDLGFDNPYQRSFSNYERYKGTIAEDYFRLEDPLYGMLFTNSSQPQAERGFYVSTRYRWAEPFITTVEWDTWRRQGDMSKYSRIVGRVEYRILFPLRFKLRQKWQSREKDNLLDPSIFDNIETRFELEYRLSRFDQLEFLYATSYTQWPPRGRLQANPEADGLSPISGNNAEPGEAFAGLYTHHFKNGRVKLDGGFFVYDGFLWFFEKNTFRVVDGTAFRSYVEITDRLSDDWTLRLRLVRENQLRNTAVDVRQFNEEVGSTVDAGDVKKTTNYFRVQLDVAF